MNWPQSVLELSGIASWLPCIYVCALSVNMHTEKGGGFIKYPPPCRPRPGTVSQSSRGFLKGGSERGVQGQEGESLPCSHSVDLQLVIPWEASLEVQRGPGTPVSSCLPLQFSRAGPALQAKRECLRPPSPQAKGVLPQKVAGSIGMPSLKG